MTCGTVFNLQRFCTQDGPGIRTTVFLKGCPLHCIWCHNPESQRAQPEILFSPEKCIGCGDCGAVCPQGLHTFEAGQHRFHREGCTACGGCAGACCTDALELCGHRATVSELVEQLTRDREFYVNTGGGVTLSGGEPMAQPEFSLALAKACHEAGLTVCMETSGFCAPEALERIAPYIDRFLYDYKLSDPAQYPAYIGGDAGRILSNLELLNRLGSTIVLRCPIIPGINEDARHFSAIAALAGRLSAVVEIDLEPYHPLGLSKLERLGRAAAYDNPDSLRREALDSLASRLRAQVSVPVCVL